MKHQQDESERELFQLALLYCIFLVLVGVLSGCVEWTIAAVFLTVIILIMWIYALNT